MRPSDEKIQNVIKAFDGSTGFLAGHEPSTSSASGMPKAKPVARGRGKTMAAGGTEPVPKRARGRGRGR